MQTLTFYQHYNKVANLILFIAKTSFKEGQELFLNYGSTFFPKEAKTKKLKKLSELSQQVEEKRDVLRKRKRTLKLVDKSSESEKTVSDYSELQQESTDTSARPKRRGVKRVKKGDLFLDIDNSQSLLNFK